MDPSAAGLIGAGIGVGGTLGVEALRQLAADRSKRADRLAESAGYHRDNLIGLQNACIDVARNTSRVMDNRKSRSGAGTSWAHEQTMADPTLVEEWRLARSEMLKYQVRIYDDSIRESVAGCGNRWMAAVNGNNRARSETLHREADEIFMNDVNPRIGELLRATY